jgi:hypothetical protein
MPDRAFINNFLKINGVSADASDVQVGRVLKDAHWTDDEIKTALTILRGDVDDSGIVAVTKHDAALFRPDIDISSRQLSRLLGVDVIVDPSLIHHSHRKRSKQNFVRNELAIWTIIILLSIILALVIAWLLMFTMKIGPYRDTISWIQ